MDSDELDTALMALTLEPVGCPHLAPNERRIPNDTISPNSRYWAGKRVCRACWIEKVEELYGY